MNPDAIWDETPGQAATRGDPVSGSGVLEDAQSLWHELHELIHDRIRLAASGDAAGGQEPGGHDRGRSDGWRVADQCLARTYGRRRAGTGRA